MKEKEEELYLEYRSLTEQMQKIQQFLEQTTENISELKGTVNAVETLAGIKKGSHIFAPIANGIFVDATLNDPHNLRMNVGGKVVVAKSTKAAKELLEKQLTKLQQIRDRATQEYSQTMTRLRQIEATVEEK